MFRDGEWKNGSIFMSLCSEELHKAETKTVSVVALNSLSFS